MRWHVNGLFKYAALVLAALPAAVCAQSGEGALHGRVTDPSGAILVDTEVVLRSSAGRTSKQKTDLQGNYKFQNVKPGDYSVAVTAKGFGEYAQNVTVAAGQDQKLDIALEISVQHTAVTVEEGEQGPDASNPDANTSALVLKGKDLDALSDDPDQLESQLQALAGPAAGPNGGQIYVDGFTGGKLPPKNAIREIRINQNPFSAEFDKIGFGRIEVLSKPGANSFHGRFMMEGNDSHFDSRNPFLSQRPDYHSTLGYASLDGPLGKRASFFLTAERRNYLDSSPINAVVLDPNFNPVSFNGSLDNPGRLTEINPRVDYQLAANNTMSARYQFYTSSQGAAGVGQLALASQAFKSGNTEHDLQISDTQLIGPTMVNDARFQFRYDSIRQTALDSAPQISVLGTFTGGGNSQGNSDIIQRHYELHDYMSIARGNHIFRYGLRLRATSTSSLSTQNFNGTFTFPSITAFQITERGLQQALTPAQIRAAGGGASQFSIIAGQPQVSETAFDAGIFAQDDFHLRPNFTFSYGLRYETQNDIHDHASFAPRVGLAWGLGAPKKGSSPKTVLRAGAGVFYDRLAQNLVLNTLRLNGIRTRQFIVQSPDFFPSVPALNALSAAQLSPTVYQIDPKLTSPYTIQTAVTLERKLSHNSTVAVTWLNSRGIHQLLSRNINAPFPGTFDPQVPGSGTRPLGNIGDIYQYQSGGVFRQNQITTSFRLRATSWLKFNGYHVLNFANSNTGGAGSFPVNQFDLSSDYGRAAYDVRHRLAMFSSFDLPHGFRLIPFLVASSGHPFNITVGQDLNGDSIFNDRPAFASSASAPGVVVTRFGAFDTNPQPGARIIPQNFGDGPAQFNLNVRFSKTFALGESIDISADQPKTGTGGANTAAKPKKSQVFGGVWRPQYALRFDVIAANVFNYVNGATPIGNLNSSLFGRSNALLSNGSISSGNRQIDLQVQFIF